MAGATIRLRRRRTRYAARRSAAWRLSLIAAVLALLIGVACLAPMAAPSVLGTNPGSRQPAIQTVPDIGSAEVVAVVPADMTTTAPGTSIGPGAAPLAAPTLGIPQVLTVSTAGQALLTAVKGDRTAQWVKNHAETPLRSGPDDGSTVFTRLPQWTVLKQVESRPNWLLVQYSGDGATREPGLGWIKASDVGAIDAPAVWLGTARTTSLWSSPEASATRLADLPSPLLMEVIGPDYVSATRTHVQLPGDGRLVPPMQGWVDADALNRAPTPSTFELPWAYPEDLRADVRLTVPYRTQLDGSDYAGANCGPTALGMALEAFGLNSSPAKLRAQVLTSEDSDPRDTDAGSYIWALADVARSYGLQADGLYESDGSTLHRWTVDELRAAVKQKEPVIIQVYYRGLPGREDSGYYGDHYVVLTGLVGDSFLYNDPIGGAEARESPGYDRLISSTRLSQAMRASDSTFQHTAFGLSRS